MLCARRVKTVGILVVYFESYANSALEAFKRIIRKTDPDGLLLVVNNNPGLELNLPPDVVLIQGSNLLHEFGGWQLGIAYLRKNGVAADARLFYFANDTLCHHHRMSWIERLAFRSSVQRLAQSKPAAAGQVSSMGRSFSLGGPAIGSWISTYLFALNHAALERLRWQIHGPYAEVEQWVPGGVDESMFFAQHMDTALKLHLTAWLFGRANLPKWYRAEPLTAANAAFFKAKALTIVCEKLLSMRLKRDGIEVHSVFEPKRVQLLLKLTRGLRKVCRREPVAQ